MRTSQLMMTSQVVQVERSLWDTPRHPQSLAHWNSIQTDWFKSDRRLIGPDPLNTLLLCNLRDSSSTDIMRYLLELSPFIHLFVICVSRLIHKWAWILTAFKEETHEERSSLRAPSQQWKEWVWLKGGAFQTRRLYPIPGPVLK